MVLSRQDVRDLEGLLNELKVSDISDGFDEALQSIDTYTNIYRRPQYDILSVKHNNHIIAFCVGEQREDEYFILMSYVGENHRRKGLGLEMKNMMITKAKDRNCKSIYSTVRSDNVASYNMNLKAGWEISRAWYRFKKDLLRSDKHVENTGMD